MEFGKVLQLVGKHLGSEGADWVVVGGLALAAQMADIVALLRATGLGADSVKMYFDRHDLSDAWEQVRDSL